MCPMTLKAEVAIFYIDLFPLYFKSNYHSLFDLHHRETSRDALLEFTVSTENLSVCLRLQCNKTKLYTKKFDGLLVNDDKIVN